MCVCGWVGGCARACVCVATLLEGACVCACARVCGSVLWVGKGDRLAPFQHVIVPRPVTDALESERKRAGKSDKASSGGSPPKNCSENEDEVPLAVLERVRVHMPVPVLSMRGREGSVARARRESQKTSTQTIKGLLVFLIFIHLFSSSSSSSFVTLLFDARSGWG